MRQAIVAAFSALTYVVAGDEKPPPILLRNLTTTKYTKSWDLSTCILPTNSATGEWKVGSLLPKTFFRCTDHDDQFPWIRLKTYRSGGWKFRHWKYLDDDTDTSRCMKDWLYYDRDGTTLIAKVEGYSTTLRDRDSRPWCATWTYQSGGKRGYQWDYCTNCTMVVTHPGPDSLTEKETPEPTLKTKITQERS